MDVGKAFTFVFKDKEWVFKVLIGAAIMALGILTAWMLLIPLVIAAALLLGYGVEITRRVIRGNPQELPEWSNWGAFIVDGLKLIVIGIVYALPIIIVSTCVSLPVGILNDGTDTANAFVTLASTCTSLLGLAWAVVMSLLLPPAIGLFADTGELGAAFRFREVWSLLRNNFVTYLVTFLMTWVASLIGSLGAIVCGVGWLVTMPYSYMVSGHLVGQAYVLAKGQAAPVVVEPTA